MKKLNLQQHYPDYYNASDRPEVVHIADTSFISVTAKGSFTEKIFYERITLLKQVTQAVIDIFQDSAKAFEMSVLEGLYWNDPKYGEHTIAQVFDAGPLNELNYRLMIRVPEYVTAQHVNTALEALPVKDKSLASGVSFFQYQEGKSIQMLHKGPFVNEFETLGQLEDFAAINNAGKRGIHHEIYLVDFTTGGSQEHLRTILREPVT